MSTKICRHHVKGACHKGAACPYIHKEDVCFTFFMYGRCKYNQECKQSHEFRYVYPEGAKVFTLRGNAHVVREARETREQPRGDTHVVRKHRQDGIKQPKNTESFVPSHEPSDMRMVYADASNMASTYPHPYRSRDVFVVNNLFAHRPNIYDELLREINDTDTQLWKRWHGDSHLIADDHVKGWKEKCPTFAYIIEGIRSYFKVDVKATRFNWYKDGSDWKPLHHDAAAIDADKAKTQNTTIGVSFGRTRSAVFEHAKKRTTMELPLDDGVVYGFASAFNREWRHGITQLTEAERAQDDRGRISIIVWGWVDEVAA